VVDKLANRLAVERKLDWNYFWCKMGSLSFAHEMLSSGIKQEQ